MSCGGEDTAVPASDGTRVSTAPETVVVDMTGDDVAEWSTDLAFSSADFDDVFLGESETVFARLSPNGALVVSAGAELWRLGPERGSKLRVARQGDGPGEFHGVSGLGVAFDGSLFATDYSNGRLTQFEVGGEVRRILPRIPPFAEGAETVALSLLPEGRILGIPVQWRPARPSYQGIQGGPFLRDPVPLLVLDSAGVIVDSVGRWSGLERVDGIVVPFARSVMYHSRGAWTAIGATDSLDVSLYHGTELAVRVIGPGRKIIPSAQLRRERDSAIVLALPRVGQMLTQRMADVAGPPLLPAFGGVVVDDDQNLWLGEYLPIPRGHRKWWVLSKEGQLLATIELPAFGEILLPARTELLDVSGGRLVLLRQGDDGRIEVEVRSILRE